MEMGPINKVLTNPDNSYTKSLIAAISEPDPNNLYKEKKILFKDTNKKKIS